MAHDVFISYPGKDKTVADAVCAKLEDQKIRCWIAPRDIPAGKNFAESIIDAIDSSKVFVLIWSMNTNSSEHILNEINQAFNQGIPIIPFRIQEVEPTSAMRYYFGRTHWLDALTPPLERHIDILAGSIRAILDRTPEGIPEPVAVETEPEYAKPSTPETELKFPPERDDRQGREEKEKIGSSIATAIKSPPVSPRKHRTLIPIAAGVLVVAAIVELLLSGVFEGSPFAEKSGTVPPTTTPAISIATKTPVFTSSNPTVMLVTSTPTVTPAWMEEVNVWANPILAAIKEQPPDFEDIFSERDSAWDVSSEERFCPAFDPAGKFIVRNGELLLVLSPTCRFLNFTHPGIEEQLGDYVLQTDVGFVTTAIGITFSVFAEQKPLLGFILKDGNWSLIIPVPGSEEGMQTIQEGALPFDPFKPVTFTVIKNEATFLFYLDEMLMLSYGIPTDRQGPQRVVFAVETWGDQLSDSESITLDNVRFWDLDSLFIPERILVQIDNEPPAFTDDFSSVDPAWQFVEDPSGEYNPDNANMEISDGSMNCSMQNVWGGVLSYSDMVYKNYVLQMDVDFKGNPIGMEFRMWDQSASNLSFRVDSPGGDWSIQKGQVSEVYTGSVAPDKKVDFSKPVRITIINKSPYFLVYLNSDQLLSFSNQDAEGPFLLDFVLGTGGSELLEQVMVDLDDVKIWNLDN